MDLRLAPVDHGVPACIRVAVNGHFEIAGADPLLHDFFKFQLSETPPSNIRLGGVLGLVVCFDLASGLFRSPIREA
jgi:hypothetical protein